MITPATITGPIDRLKECAKYTRKQTAHCVDNGQAESWYKGRSVGYDEAAAYLTETLTEGELYLFEDGELKHYKPEPEPAPIGAACLELSVDCDLVEFGLVDTSQGLFAWRDGKLYRWNGTEFVEVAFVDRFPVYQLGGQTKYHDRHAVDSTLRG